MSIWVIIDTFKSNDIIRKPKTTILAFWWCPGYDVIMTSKQRQYHSNSYITYYNPTNYATK